MTHLLYLYILYTFGSDKNKACPLRLQEIAIMSVWIWLNALDSAKGSIPILSLLIVPNPVVHSGTMIIVAAVWEMISHHYRFS
jgi:hypothetical protein